MGEQTEKLIQQVVELTKSRLSTTEIADLTDEVRAHLDASIQARLELGMSPVEAEQEAIASFGPAKTFVEGIVPPRKVDKLSGKMTFAATLTAIACAASLGVTRNLSQPLVITAYYLPVLAGIGLVAWAGRRSGRVHLVSLLSALIVALPLCAILVSRQVIAGGNAGYLNKQELSWQSTTATFNAGWYSNLRFKLDTANRKAIQTVESTPGPYEVPMISTTGEFDSVFATQSRSEALKRLAQNRDNRETQWAADLAGLQRSADEASQLLATPTWLNTLRCLQPASEDAASLCLLIALAQAIGAAGRKLSLIKRRSLTKTRAA